MNTTSDEPSWVRTVLDFWFEEVGPRYWFTGGPAIDAKVRERFLHLHETLSHARDESRQLSPRVALATILVLDQFSRHLFRGTPRAYSTDSLACGLARVAVERGLDAGMSADERQFLYMPLQHSEDPADQALSVRLVRALGNDEWTRYAVEHRDVIEKFGRFPHRNAILGRESTPAEREAIAAGAVASW